MEKIQIRLIFSSDFHQKDDFINKILATEMFYNKIPIQNYFPVLIEQILSNKDVHRFIDLYEDENECIPALEVYVTNKRDLTLPYSYIFEYNESMTSAEFYKNAELIRKMYLLDVSTICNENKSHLKNIFNSFKSPKKSVADAFYIKGDYSNALYYYNKLSINRMIEICNIYLDRNFNGFTHSLDVLINSGSKELMFSWIWDSPESNQFLEIRLAGSYYLKSVFLEGYKHIFLLYACCQGFYNIKNVEKFNECYAELIKSISQKGKLNFDFKNQLENEFKMEIDKNGWDK